MTERDLHDAMTTGEINRAVEQLLTNAPPGAAPEGARQWIIDAVELLHALMEREVEPHRNSQSVLRGPDPGPTYMVTGYGETDFPEVLMARSLDEVADAYCNLVFGHPFAETLSEAQDEADRFTKEVERHDWAEEPVYASWTFEIGGVKVERVYARQFGGANTLTRSALEPSTAPLSRPFNPETDL